MGSVTSIDKSGELGRFFDYLYGDQIGYVYSPTKDLHTGSWKQYFFEWPTGRAKLIQHVLSKTDSLEVYHGVALFKNKGSEKHDIFGTRFIWTEFDGATPALDNGTPPPSIRIQSSVTGHEHWYWELPGFITDVDVIENINQRIAYYLDADKSSWDANQVLRPPGTTHQQSKATVAVLADDRRVTPIERFATLPDLPSKQLKIDDIGHIPLALDVIATTGPWAQEHIEFFREMKMEKGDAEKGIKGRSSALTKLGFLCIEYGLTNAQALALLLNADERWGKFKGRRKQKKHLIDIINYCRSQKPIDIVEEETKSKFKIYTYEEFMNTDIKLEWVVPNLLHKKGLLLLTGPPKIGKSQFFMRLSEKMAKGESFLKWQVPRPMKTLFVSMEMPHEEVRYFYDQMQISTNELMNNNMLIMPIGSSIRFNSPAARHELNKVIEEFQPDGIWFDSFGRAVADDINSEKIIFQTFDYVDSVLRGEYGCFVGFVHHNRKAQIGNKKPKKLEDAYGNQYIGAAVTSGIGLWEDKPGSGEIEVNCLALRMSKFFNPFMIHRTPGLDFEMHQAKILSPSTPILGGVEGGIGGIGDSI